MDNYYTIFDLAITVVGASIDTLSLPASGGISRKLRSIPFLRRSVLSARLIRTRAIDAVLGVDTAQPQGSGGGPAAARFQDGLPFAPLDYLAINRFLRPVKLCAHDVFIDIGCGNGRVLCLAARHSIKKCVGIEYRAPLAVIAADNTRSLRGRRCPVDIFAEDAAESDYSEGTVFWLFNPFGRQTMCCVIRRIVDSLRVAPRKIQIIYVRPVHGDVLASYGLNSTRKIHLPAFNADTATYWTNAGA